MIRIGKLTDYAIVILANLYEQDEKLMSASDLSELTRFPLPTVSKILKILSSAQIVNSIRGANGGYALNDRDISIRTIIEAMEGPVAITSCCAEDDEDACSLEASCIAKGRWTPVNEAIKKTLEDMKLADMVGSRYRKKVSA